MEYKKKPGFRKWIILILVLLGPGIALYTCSKKIASQGRQKMIPLPVIGTLDDFELRKEDGEVITLESLKGQITIITTLQNTCPDSCGVQLSQANELLYETIYTYREEQNDVKIMSIAMDSEGKPVKDFDKVNFVLGKYIRNCDPSIWSIVTGDAESFYDVEINGNRLYDQVSKGSYGGKLFMSSLLLIDKSGQVRSMRLGNGEAQVRDFAGELRGLIGEYRHASK